MITTSSDAGRSSAAAERAPDRSHQKIDHAGDDAHQVQAAERQADQRAGLVRGEHGERGGSHNRAEVEHGANPGAERKELQESNYRRHRRAPLSFASNKGKFPADTRAIISGSAALVFAEFGHGEVITCGPFGCGRIAPQPKGPRDYIQPEHARRQKRLGTTGRGLGSPRRATMAEWRIRTTWESGWWAIKDLNLGPLPCEGSALTN